MSNKALACMYILARAFGVCTINVQVLIQKRDLVKMHVLYNWVCNDHIKNVKIVNIHVLCTF